MVLLLNFKSLHGQGATYLKRLLIPYVPTRALRSDKMLCLPQTHYVETCNRGFSVMAPEECNCLSKDVRESDCVSAFK